MSKKQIVEGAVSVAEVLGTTIAEKLKDTGNIIEKEANIKFYQLQRKNAMLQLGEQVYRTKEIPQDLIKQIDSYNEAIRNLLA